MRFFIYLYISIFTVTIAPCFGQEAEDIVRLGEAINSEYAERMPLISLDGKVLYFARKSHPQNMGSENKDDIWVSYLNPKTKQWTKAINVGAPLNNDEHNFVVSINTSGDAMYLANDYNKSLRDAISYTVKKGRKWSNPFTIDIPDYENKSLYVSYHVSKDEKYLLIAAEQNDTEGGRDFYVCFKTKQGWSAPTNLGADINTKSEENSIFLAADNRTVYFSSGGHSGLGGYDLFMSKRLDDTWTSWSKPVNLGPTFNTPSNDLSISIPASGDFAYIARGPIDNTDIYRIKIPEALKPAPVTYIQAQLVDAETNEPIDGRIFFESLNDKEEKRIFNGQEAKYISQSEQDMGIYAQAKGYFPSSTYFANEEDAYESVDGDNSAYQEDEELQALQNRLDDLQRELKKLKEKKEHFRKGSKKQKTTTVAQSTKRANANAGTFKNVGEEDELADLKSKFQSHFEDQDIPAQKKEARAKNSDSDDLKKAREKYQQFYDTDESEKEENPKEKVSLEKANSYITDVLKDMFGDYFLPTLKTVKREEGIQLSSKDVTGLEEIVKLEMYDEWRPQIAKILKNKYSNNLAKENKILIKRDLKDVFSDDLYTNISMLVKRQKEKTLQQNITKQLSTKNKLLVTTPQKVDKVIKAPTYQRIEKELTLIPLKKGAELTMNNIFFDVNKANLKPQSNSELKRISTFLISNPQLSIEIGGHANGWCSKEFANQLSSDRAESVYNYFVLEGIDKKRITFKGYGKSDPIASNNTVAGRKKNQRVVLKIIDIIE